MFLVFSALVLQGNNFCYTQMAISDKTLPTLLVVRCEFAGNLVEEDRNGENLRLESRAALKITELVHVKAFKLV